MPHYPYRPFILIVFFFFAANIFLVAGDKNGYPAFESINTESGLPHNTIQNIFQDSEGYIWIATKDGLCRYDGFDYVTYRESLERESVSNSKIRSIAEDDNRNVWVGTEHGLNRLNLTTGHIHSFFSDTEPLFKSDFINDLYFDKATHELWIATDKGISIYNTDRQAFIPVSDKELSENRVNTICGSFSYSNDIFIGTSKGLCLCNRYTKDVRNICLASGEDIGIQDILPDSAGNIWLGTNRSLLAVVQAGTDTIRLLPYGRHVTDVCSLIEDDGVVWIVTRRNGIWFYDIESKDTTGPIYPNNDTHTLLSCGYKDKDGNIWIGSYYKGVFFHSEYLNRFRLIEIISPLKKSEGIFGTIVPHNGKLWLGCEDTGITLYDRASGNQIHYDLYENGIPIAECKPMLIDGNNLWIATESSGIVIYDLAVKAVREIYTANSPEREIPGNRVNHIFRDSYDNIWIGINGGNGGICRFDRSRRVFETYYPDDSSHKVRDVYYIAEISDGLLWLGTRNNGLFIYDIRKNTFTPISIAGTTGLSISYILKDSRERVWVGTFGQGLICLNLDGNVTGIFDMSDQQGGNNICSIIEDRNRNIWISSFYSIAQYDGSIDNFTKYDNSNGFPLKHVKPMSSLVAEDGVLYFGGENGMVEVNPDDLMPANPSVPRPVLTSLMINSCPADSSQRAEMIASNMLKLKYNQNNLAVKFAALGYIYPTRNLCRYMLDGADTRWNTVKAQEREVRYNNLPAGKYNFIMSASTGGGSWSEPVRLFSVRIYPAPWATWWAYSLYGIIILSLAGLFLYYSQSKIRLEHNLEIEEMEKENADKMHRFRLDLFTNFSHEIRTPLTLVSGSLDDLIESDSKHSAPLLHIRRNVLKITELVNQLMDFRKHDSGKMELAATEQELSPFIREMGIIFKELSRIQNHPLEISISSDTELCLWFNPTLMEKVFYNVLMNAFKYSSEESPILLTTTLIDLEESEYRSRVDVHVKTAVLIAVSNKGTSIPEDKIEEIFQPFYRLGNSLDRTGTGIGLSFNRMIMRLHHSDIWAESTTEGVAFKFAIPVGCSHLEDSELAVRTEDTHVFDSCSLETVEDAARYESTYSSSKTLLIVEDNDEIRKYLKDKLSVSYKTMDCSNGREALEILYRIGADLIISDVMMPEMDGIELCRSIKNNQDLNHIPVILLTAHIADEHVKAGISAGADDYVTKPFNFDLLLTRIETILTNNDRLRMAFQKRVSPEEMNVKVRDYDEEFLQKCYGFLQAHLTDSDLTIEDFGSELGMSRVNLYRKIKALTDLSPSRFILNHRLKIASELLMEKGSSISDICYRVGFNNLSYFTRTFKEAYGLTPSEYAARNNNVS